jgi:wyosine [tRNA(Phe)-imidazoG37] synthetase (radical SAM superfamily)
MNQEINEQDKKTIYGPVLSWRFGMSLGIDPIFKISTCSFNCTYCQLGQIQHVTNERKVYVPTEQIEKDFQEFLKLDQLNNTGLFDKTDVITFSGSGEPTLALNLGEIHQSLKKDSGNKKFLILTNGSTLGNPDVCKDLTKMDKVIIKLDAVTEKSFNLVNRPTKELQLTEIINNIKHFKKYYRDDFEIQSMFMPMNYQMLDEFVQVIEDISPAGIQINTPKRPYPHSWHRENRGKHSGTYDYKTSTLQTIENEQIKVLEAKLQQIKGATVHSRISC